jgi:hypothetical protein
LGDGVAKKKVEFMLRLKYLFAFVLLFVSVSVSAQTESFSRAGLDYTLELPSSAWRLVSPPDNNNQPIEFIYGDRSDGYLRVRKEIVENGVALAEMARRDQDLKLSFLPGFVAGKQEPFTGRYSGQTLSYEYTNGGKLMSGRIYYVQVDGRTVYTLHFTGLRDKLQRIRNQTDFIARGLKLKS